MKKNNVKLSITIFLLLFLTACSENQSVQNLDGKKFLNTKCSSCHNLNMPPLTSDDELAPPMMAVAFHVYSFVKPTDESQRNSRAKEFVVDYVLNPALEKSFCDKDSLKRYGLMPSQKGKVSQDELKAIASYMFKHFTQDNLTRKQKDESAYNALSVGKKIALKHGCLTCHRINKKIVGPSFVDIAKKYKSLKKHLTNSIRNGSKNRWKSSRGAIMPAFKDIDDKDLKILLDWISTQNPIENS